MSGRPFTETEDGHIRRLYPDGGPLAVMPYVQRSKPSITQRAVLLGIPCDRAMFIQPADMRDVPLPGMTAEDRAAARELAAWARPTGLAPGQLRWAL